jgi:hypothetical protein
VHHNVIILTKKQIGIEESSIQRHILSKEAKQKFLWVSQNVLGNGQNHQRRGRQKWQ